MSSDEQSTAAPRRAWLDRLLLLVGLVVAGIATWLFISTPLSLQWQAFTALVTIIVGLLLRRRRGGEWITHLMVALSVLSTSRYLFWRITETLPLGEGFDTIDRLFALGLILAECYMWGVLVLGFFQSIRPLRRRPVALPEDPEQWPTVDVFIPTYDEPLHVVRPTVLAALALDWPKHKFRVHVLDDGRRPDFARFCAEVGAQHITRPDNKHAKAGNINHALSLTDGDFIAIFDCDHIPTRSFLQMTAGAMVNDPKLSLVQTPHHFFSPDPFERNLGTFRQVPNEGELFYGLLQDGNDFWNATFFCGSCALLRREALDEIGGIAVETVTEDAHTSLKMHRRGWRSAYINIPQAAGLATESLSAHVGQRIRWSRGMAQIMRIDNPLFGPGLSLAQRLCYFNAMAHFLYGIPRLVFLTAPLAYLLLDAKVIVAQGLMIAVYALPHLFMAVLTNSRLQGAWRHSFWAEVYETVLAVFIIIPTTLALLNPRLGKFNVTAKGGLVDRDYFDGDIARPYYVLCLLNAVGLIVGAVRIFAPDVDVDVDTLLLNMFWSIYNLIMLGAALSVASERRQLRRSVRVKVRLPVSVRRVGDRGPGLASFSQDLSYGGLAVEWLPELAALGAKAGERIEVALIPGRRPVWMPATVRRTTTKRLAVEFEPLDLAQESQLVYALYGRADAWLHWRGVHHRDHPLRALGSVFKFGYMGMIKFFRWGIGNLMRNLRGAPKQQSAGLLIAALAGSLLLAPAPASARDSDDATEQRGFTLESMGAVSPLRLRTTFGQYSLPLSLRSDQVATHAELWLDLAHSPALRPDLSHMKVLLNNELVDTWPLLREAAAGDQRRINVDPKLLLRHNELRFEMVASYAIDECEDPTHPTLWSQISNQSRLTVTLADVPSIPDLGHLPAPFFDAADGRRLSIPFVFGSAPEVSIVNAAAIVASWFGLQADYRGAEFPVRLATLPDGHAVVLRTRTDDVPALAHLPIPQTPELRVIVHPDHANARLLVISGRDGAGVLRAARGLVYGRATLRGASVSVEDFSLPAPAEANTAPRWADPSEPIALADYALGRMEARGFAPGPIQTEFRLPPDLYIVARQGPTLSYRYRSAGAVGEVSALSVLLNDHFVGDDRLFSGNREQVGERRIRLPKSHISHRNRINWHFNFVRHAEIHCQPYNPELLQGSIDRDAQLTIPRHAFYARMPALELFADGGFPFTRYADGSQTAFVLPDAPTADDLGALLTLAGHLGNQTGAALLRSEVYREGMLPTDLDRDLLVVGRSDRLRSTDILDEDAPLRFDGNRVQLRRHSTIATWLAKARGQDVVGARNHAGEVIHNAGYALGVVVATESPFAAGRTLVIVSAGRNGSVFDMARTVIDPGQAQYWSGDLTLMHGDTVSGYSLGSTYAVGKLPWDYRLRLWLSRHPFLVVLVLIVTALLIVLLIRRLLRGRAQARLAGER